MITKTTAIRANCILILILCLFFTACSRFDGSVSRGQLDNIGCFLFVFDTRSAQQQLVRDMEEDKIPAKISAQLYEVHRNVDGTETEVPIKGRTFETEDPELIKKVYYAITDMIVVGQMGVQNNRTRCRLTFTLADGQTCELVFQSRASLEIGKQNYLVESNNSMWELIENIY